ncbi:MAG TPA: hypothetical protein VGM37_12280 [Armatimonadota bacterium]|jgi:hypothetical protein
MIQLALPKNKKARVWFDPGELDLRLGGERVERVVPCRTTTVQRDGFAAVEFFSPAGHHQYALLGARFSASDTSELRVRVVNGAVAGNVPGSIAALVELLHVGLLPEYVYAVLDVAATEGAAGRLGCGDLDFEMAAHGDIGSSLLAFKSVTCMVLRLLLVNESERQDEAVIAQIIEDGPRVW